MSKILEIDNVHKSFGGLDVLTGVSFTIEQNTLTGFIGPNGAGKSTLFNCISGILPTDKGEIRLFGQPLAGLSPAQRNLLGMSRTFQDTRLFKELTVLENLMLPPKGQIGENIFDLFSKVREVKLQEEELLQKALDTLRLLEIEHMGYEYAKNLSGGQSKLVDLGRVLMSEPQLLLLDEPTAGVAPVLTQKLFDKIVSLRDELDLTIVIIEHDMDVIMKEDVDMVYVLSSGNIVAKGTPTEVQKNQEVIEAYLGR